MTKFQRDAIKLGHLTPLSDEPDENSFIPFGLSDLLKIVDALRCKSVRTTYERNAARRHKRHLAREARVAKLLARAK